jgi:hypothetical protein
MGRDFSQHNVAPKLLKCPPLLVELKVSAARHRKLVEDFRECAASVSVACDCQIDHLFEAIAIVCKQVAVYSLNYLVELSVIVLYSSTPKTKYLLLVQRHATRMVDGAVSYFGHDVSPQRVRCPE